MDYHVVKHSGGQDLKFRGKKIATAAREMANLSMSTFLIGKIQARWKTIQLYRTEEDKYVVSTRDEADRYEAVVCAGAEEVVAALTDSSGELCWLAKEALQEAGGELEKQLYEK